MATKDYTSDSGIGERLGEVQRIKLEIDRLNDLLDKQKAYLLGHAIRNNLDSLRCGAVAVSRRERASWTYSKDLQYAEAKVKKRKSREQQTGVAINQPTEHLVVTFSAKVAIAQQISLEKA